MLQVADCELSVFFSALLEWHSMDGIGFSHIGMHHVIAILNLRRLLKR